MSEPTHVWVLDAVRRRALRELAVLNQQYGDSPNPQIVKNLCDAVMNATTSDCFVRLDTGVIRNGDDWPSYHLRGDDAISLYMMIDTILTMIYGQEGLYLGPENAPYTLRWHLRDLKRFADDLEKTIVE